MTLAETRRGGGEILAVVTQSDLSRRLRIMAGGGGGYAICSGGHG